MVFFYVFPHLFGAASSSALFKTGIQELRQSAKIFFENKWLRKTWNKIVFPMVPLLAILALFVPVMAATSLQDYVFAPDGTFDFVDTGIRRQGQNWTAHIYNLTSQAWLTPLDVSRSVWWHHFVIVVPDNLNKGNNKALLFISSRWNTEGSYPEATDNDVKVAGYLAVQSQIVVAVLCQVPNQDIIFYKDPLNRSRHEDGAMAFSWFNTMQHPEVPQYNLIFPMVKSAVRAMDAMEALLPKWTGRRINQFIVMGISKRGWTTWLTAAVDRRVVAIVPIVMTILDIRSFFHRQWQSYGGWTYALRDYWEGHIMELVDTPEFAELSAVIDPFSYRQQLTMPKLAVSTVGDEFMMPDDQRFWAASLPREMDLLVLKNTEHTLNTAMEELLQGVGAFTHSIVAQIPRPAYSWKIDPSSGEISVFTSVAPSLVTLVYAKSPKSDSSTSKRDFRWGALNVVPCVSKYGACDRQINWTTTTNNITKISDQHFTVKMDPPTDGTWVGFFMEVTFPNPQGPVPFLFTTAVSVLPNTYPYADCQGKACNGTLL